MGLVWSWRWWLYLRWQKLEGGPQVTLPPCHPYRHKWQLLYRWAPGSLAARIGWNNQLLSRTVFLWFAIQLKPITGNPPNPFLSQIPSEHRRLQWFSRPVPTTWAIPAHKTPGLKLFCYINRLRHTLYTDTSALQPWREPGIPLPYFIPYTTRGTEVISVETGWDHLCDSSCCPLHGTGCTGSSGSRTRTRGIHR